MAAPPELPAVTWAGVALAGPAVKVVIPSDKIPTCTTYLATVCISMVPRIVVRSFMTDRLVVVAHGHDVRRRTRYRGHLHPAPGEVDRRVRMCVFAVPS